MREGGLKQRRTARLDDSRRKRLRRIPGTASQKRTQACCGGTGRRRLGFHVVVVHLQPTTQQQQQGDYGASDGNLLSSPTTRHRRRRRMSTEHPHITHFKVRILILLCPIVDHIVQVAGSGACLWEDLRRIGKIYNIIYDITHTHKCTHTHLRTALCQTPRFEARNTVPCYTLPTANFPSAFQAATYPPSSRCC